MAEVAKIDIDGIQWDIKDQNARNRIAELEKNVIVQDIDTVHIDLKQGFTAQYAIADYHYKVGKIHFINIRLQNIKGTYIGTSSTANFGSLNIRPKKQTSFLLYDYINKTVLRCYIDKDGSICIGESLGVAQGNNDCFGELIFAEE